MILVSGNGTGEGVKVGGGVNGVIVGIGNGVREGVAVLAGAGAALDVAVGGGAAVHVGGTTPSPAAGVRAAAATFVGNAPAGWPQATSNQQRRSPPSRQAERLGLINTSLSKSAARNMG